MTALERQKIKEGIRLAMAVSADANKFITDTEPFRVVKTDMAHAGTLVAAGALGSRGTGSPSGAHCAAGWRGRALLARRALSCLFVVQLSQRLAFCCTLSVPPPALVMASSEPLIACPPPRPLTLPSLPPPCAPCTMSTAAIGCVRIVAALIEPYMPTLTEAILGQLRLPLEYARLSDELIAGTLNPATLVPAGHEIGTPTPLISEIKDEVVEALRERFAGSQADRAAAAAASSSSAQAAAGGKAASSKGAAAAAAPADGKAAKGGKAAAAPAGAAAAAAGAAAAGGKAAKGGGGGGKAEERAVDVSRLDIRVGRILKVSCTTGVWVKGTSARARRVAGPQAHDVCVQCAAHLLLEHTSLTPMHQSITASSITAAPIGFAHAQTVNTLQLLPLLLLLLPFRRGATLMPRASTSRKSMWGRRRHARCVFGKEQGAGHTGALLYGGGHDRRAAASCGVALLGHRAAAEVRLSLLPVALLG